MVLYLCKKRTENFLLDLNLICICFVALVGVVVVNVWFIAAL